MCIKSRKQSFVHNNALMSLFDTQNVICQCITKHRQQGAYFFGHFWFIAGIGFVLWKYPKNILCKALVEYVLTVAKNDFLKTTPMQTVWDPKNLTLAF